jgi:hypothetical protein
MKNAALWDVASCEFCKNLLTRPTLSYIPEDGILQSDILFARPAE